MHGQLRQGLAGIILYLVVLYRPVQGTYLLALPISSTIHFSFFAPLLLQFAKLPILLLASISVIFLEFDKLLGLYELYTRNDFDIPTMGLSFRIIFFVALFILGSKIMISSFPIVYSTIVQIFAVILLLISMGLETIADRILTIVTFLLLPILTVTIDAQPSYIRICSLLIVLTGILIWAFNSQNI
jgi:hypothetical protein